MRRITLLIALMSFGAFAKGVECKLLNFKEETLSKCQFSSFYSKKNNSHINITDCTLTGSQKERPDIRVNGKLKKLKGEETVLEFSVEVVSTLPKGFELKSDEFGRYIEDFSRFDVDVDYEVRCNSFWKPRKFDK
jgi:predicted nucleic-acid-binding Zn-ribbon protein